MISTTFTEALAGMPAQGLAVRPRAQRRAPEAFTAPYQGTGLPFGASVVDTVAPKTTATDNVHIDPTTLGFTSSRRPPG
jgi:hypothetical protein